MAVPGRRSEYTWYGTRQPEEYKFNFKSFAKIATSVAKTAISMSPAGRLAGLAGAAAGAMGGLAGAAAGAMGGGGAGGGPGGGAGGGPGGGSGPITINNPPVKVNVQISGKDMAASSGVFAEEIGVPGMTNNTETPAAAPTGADEDEDEDEGGGLGFPGGGRSRRRKRDKQPTRKGDKQPTRKGGGRRSKYTEEFSSGPQIEESDSPVLAFALIAIIISLFCD